MMFLGFCGTLSTKSSLLSSSIAANLFLFCMVGKFTSPLDYLVELMVTAVVFELLTARDYFFF